MDVGLKGKHIFISGASGGIGVVTAQLFLEQGAKVTLHYNTKNETLKDLLTKYPETTFSVQANITEEVAVINAIKQSVNKLGPIHVLIANHGTEISQNISVMDMTLDQWNSTLNINLTGSFLLTREYLKQLKETNTTENVAVVLIGSTAGIFGEAGHADYASAKSALHYGFCLTLKNEIIKIAPKGRCNVVAPGWTLTPIVQSANPADIQKALATMPLHKIAQCTDVAHAVLYLSSEKMSGHTSGQVLTVHGGMEGRQLWT